VNNVQPQVLKKDASFITYTFSHNNKKGGSELPCLLNYGDKTLILIFVSTKTIQLALVLA
jgi:hypothetical protein